MTLRFDSIWRISLALLGGFVVAASLTAAIAFVLVSEGVSNRGVALFLASYVGLIAYFGAMLWAFASNKLVNVVRGFSLLILISGILVWWQGGDASFGYGPAMARLILLIGLLVTLWIGFAALALSQDKHWQTVTKVRTCPQETSRVLKYIGWSMLSVSLALALMRDGVSFGLLLWPTIAFFMALGVALCLAYRPLSLRRFADEATSFTLHSSTAEKGTDAA